MDAHGYLIFHLNIDQPTTIVGPLGDIKGPSPPYLFSSLPRTITLCQFRNAYTLSGPISRSLRLNRVCEGGVQADSIRST